MGEIWKPVVGYEGRYEVSNLGRVRTFAKSNSTRLNEAPKLMTPDFNEGNQCSYPRVVLWKGRRGSRFMVHHLVMATFVGPRLPKIEVNHKDGNKGNPALSNLEYVTKTENERHKFEVLGHRVNQGSKHGMAKITEENVLEILRLYKTGMTCTQIAPKFSLCVSSICLMVKRKTWRHLDIPSW